MKTKATFIQGRVTLITSVLNSIPIYFFSFFKYPKGPRQAGVDSKAVFVGW